MTAPSPATLAPGSLRAWLLASRPRTLPAAAAPVIVGTALAAATDGAHWPSAVVALLTAILIQIGANFANDLFDYQKGADTAARIGPMRMTAAGALTPRAMQTGVIVVFALAVLLGAVLVWRGGWPVLVIGLICLVAGYLYTGGPYPLGYHGLGDVTCFLCFGLLGVIGTYYVNALSVSLDALVAAIPVGALITAILVVNNARDIETDRAAGKRTLAVILGRGGARAEYVALVTLSYLSVLWFVAQPYGGVWALAPWLSAPLAVVLTRAVLTETAGPPLNRALAGTAQLVALFSVLLAIGLAIPSP